ncbi:MAG: ribosomal L7Ae/L30e/S12e/Gadd45 family protein [Clostridia bacterium]
MNDAISSAIGFSMKAGKCVAGAFSVEKAIKSGNAKLIALDSNISENSRKSFLAMVKGVIPMIDVPNLGRCIGKDGKMAAAVVDLGFANMILNAQKKLNGGL